MYVHYRYAMQLKCIITYYSQGKDRQAGQGVAGEVEKEVHEEVPVNRKLVPNVEERSTLENSQKEKPSGKKERKLHLIIEKETNYIGGCNEIHGIL